MILKMISTVNIISEFIHSLTTGPVSRQRVSVNTNQNVKCNSVWEEKHMGPETKAFEVTDAAITEHLCSL